MSANGAGATDHLSAFGRIADIKVVDAMTILTHCGRYFLYSLREMIRFSAAGWKSAQ
jgi:hypothetical protein